MPKSPRNANRAKKSSPPTTQASPEKHVITTEAASSVWYWLKHRGGVAVWRSRNPDKPKMTWTTQFRNPDGTLVTQPIPDADITPERVISDPDDVVVKVETEVNRLHIHRTPDGSLSPEDNHEVCVAVVESGEGSYARYKKDSAVIFAPAKLIPLAEWMSMTDEQRQQVQAESVEAAKKRHKQEVPNKPGRGRIVDATDEWLGRGIIITGVSKPKDS
jgi:hypothetical protein